MGAFVGNEVHTYKRMNFKSILMVEADPLTYSKLKENIGGVQGIMTLNAAISDKAGTAEFHRANNLQSSSLLNMKEHRRLHPDIDFVNKFTVSCTTIDSLFDDSLKDTEINFLNIDIQGAEFMAFKGGIRSLSHFDAINAEVNTCDVYEGCLKLRDMDNFLSAFGFLRIDTHMVKGWGDAFYIKESFLA